MLEFALQYAGRGWRVFPVHTTVSGACSCGKNCGKQAGKHPRIREWQKLATTDPEQIERWWGKWKDANIGIATGDGLVVTDLDGPAEIAQFQALVAPHGGLPETLVCQTARGLHVYLAGDWPTTKKVDGLLVRGTGGYVLAPPSFHASEIRYAWAKNATLAPMPDWFRAWLQTAENHRITAQSGSTLLQGVPSYVKATKPQQDQRTILNRAKAALGPQQTPHEIQRIASALKAIPADCARDHWLHIGFALHSLHWEAPDGSDLGFEIWHRWSRTGGEKYQGIEDLETRWRSFGGREGVSLGTLFHLAERHGWIGYAPPAAPEPEAPVPFNPFGDAKPAHSNGHASAVDILPDFLNSPVNESPLIELNRKYAVIGDVGGKCLVLGWVPSKVDPTIEVPSFQSFKSFAERYGHKYVTVRVEKKDGAVEEEPKQLGAHWLKWKRRQTYEGIDLDPAQGQVLANGSLNLWRGFAVEARPGVWPLMQEHIAEVVAGGDAAALDYIMRWSAWSVQHPGERAESALVFRGGKGSGKGTFAHALRRLFGTHGLHIANSKHLVGSFNAHLRSCLLLYADEAFWAGDKQGESTLKALITEATLTIEQKGVDAVQWYNRIHLIMTANADWVVPASHDERRYAVFNVGEQHMGDKSYFEALYAELNNGGLEAMLYDLQRVDLKGWHPRNILKTQALTEQKLQSMQPIQEWWCAILEDGQIPAADKQTPDIAPAVYLLNHARDFSKKLGELNATRLGRFLSEHGCVKLHRSNGNAWRFASLAEARAQWERRYQGWKWERDAGAWEPRT